MCSWPSWGDPWWRHQMETFSALLAICAGNSPVPGEFPAQRPMTWSFDVFFDLRLNKRLSKQTWGWWLETLSCPFWRHRNATGEFTHKRSVIRRAFLHEDVIMKLSCITQPTNKISYFWLHLILSKFVLCISWPFNIICTYQVFIDGFVLYVVRKTSFASCFFLNQTHAATF